VAPGSFTVGSSKDEVLAVQGTPTQFSDRAWEYGSSSVFFSGGRVTSWDVWPGSPLKVQMLPSQPAGATKGYFTVGSSKDEVLAVQGTPTQFSDRAWEYGSSSVFFSGGRVTSWDVWPGSPLKVRMLPSQPAGATKGTSPSRSRSAPKTPERDLDRASFQEPDDATASKGIGRRSTTSGTRDHSSDDPARRTADRLRALGVHADPRTTPLGDLLDIEARARTAKRLGTLGHPTDWRRHSLSAMLDSESRISTARRLRDLGLVVNWSEHSLSEMLGWESRIGTANRLKALGRTVDWRDHTLGELLSMESKARQR